MQLTFFPNQIKKLYRVKPIINEEHKLGLNDFNTCEGSRDDKTGIFVLTFKHTEKPGWLRRWYSPDLAEKKIIPIACTWINNPILNKTGLAQAIWQDSDSSMLRRRLEQKIERGTLRMDEKQRILEAMADLYRAMKLSLK